MSPHLLGRSNVCWLAPLHRKPRLGPLCSSGSNKSSSRSASAAAPVVSTTTAAAVVTKQHRTSRVGFVGLGQMGQGMAGCLLRAGFDVSIKGNVTRAPVESLVAAGATEASGLLELAAQADIIILCLPNSNVVEEVVNAMKPGLVSGRHVVMDTGTSSLASTEILSRELVEELGVGFAEAPLTGGKAQAEEGVLGAIVGADSQGTFEAIEPVLQAFCSTVQHFGPVGAGGRAKLINNAMVIGIAALVIEAFRKARQTNTDWPKLYDVVRRGSAESGVLHRIVGTVVESDSYRGASRAIVIVTQFTSSGCSE